MNERIRIIRDHFNMTQEIFSKSIGMGQSTLGMIEVGKRDVLDRHVKIICSIFNINENWLRYGKGDMILEPDTFSLNEYAEKNNLSELELDLIKGYMDLDVDSRNQILSSIKSIFDKHSEVAATKEESQAALIDKELESYRLELEAEQKGEILSVSQDTREKKEAN